MGITLLVATHLLADLAQICDSIAVLREGKLTGVIPLAAALAGDGPARRRVQLEAVGEREQLAELLVQQPGVLDVTEQGIGISFVYEGDREGLADRAGPACDRRRPGDPLRPRPGRPRRALGGAGRGQRATGAWQDRGPNPRRHPVTWSAIVTKELASRLQGRLSYVVADPDGGDVHRPGARLLLGGRRRASRRWCR